MCEPRHLLREVRPNHAVDLDCGPLPVHQGAFLGRRFFVGRVGVILRRTVQSRLLDAIQQRAHVLACQLGSVAVHVPRAPTWIHRQRMLLEDVARIDALIHYVERHARLLVAREDRGRKGIRAPVLW